MLTSEEYKFDVPSLYILEDPFIKGNIIAAICSDIPNFDSKKQSVFTCAVLHLHIFGTMVAKCPHFSLMSFEARDASNSDHTFNARDRDQKELQVRRREGKHDVPIAEISKNFVISFELMLI
jgi:hypothetical protein